MRRVLLLILLSVASAAWGQATDERAPLDLIDECSGAAADDAVGLTALEDECAGLTTALEQSGYMALLSPLSRDQLDAYDLSDLLAVDSWYEQEPAREVDVTAVASILESLRPQQPERPLGWFERFKRWLRTMLERRSDSPDNWLSRWLDQLEVADGAVRGILMVAMALVVVLTIAVIVIELRASGMLRRRRSLQDAAMILGSAASAEGDDSQDSDTLAANRRAPILLRMLVQTLVRSGRLRTERSLTYRELCERARFDDAGQRESFGRVAALAERTLYGSAEISAAEIEPAAAAAYALDAQLRGATA